MKIKIKVTKEILQESKMCQSDNQIGMNCAIARAVRDVFPAAWVSHFNLYPFYFKDDGITSINMPAEASLFITKFDRNDANERVNMTEVSFEIDVPDDVIDQIGISEVHRILKESKTLELV